MANALERIYREPRRVEFLRTGPLADHIEGFAALLLEQGYRRSSLQNRLCAAGRLGQWLRKRAIGARDLNEARITQFIRARRQRDRGEAAAAASLLRYLRQIGVVRSKAPAPDRRNLSAIERDYERHLIQERGLGPATVRFHLYHVHRLMRDCLGSGNQRVEELSHKGITRYIVRYSPAYRPRSAQSWISVLRCFIRYLHLCGRTRIDLSGSVLRTATAHLAVLPKYLTVEQVEKLLKTPDRNTAVGLRDYAMMLLLARLGLRGGEVVKLELEDIDWQAGEFMVRGKGSRSVRLPLPQDVGEALTAYLQHARPNCGTRKVFVRALAPRGPLKGGCCVTGQVAHYLDRAGLHPAKRGAHVLRHSLATRMLGGGSSLEEIAQVLRHQHINTTEIYAKVDVTTLRSIAQPWPLGAA